MTREEIEKFVLEQHPEAKGILSQQALLEVKYISKKDGAAHNGQILVHRDLAFDIKGLFDFFLDIDFRLEKVVLAQEGVYRGDDIACMEDNNTSAMNYRLIAGEKRLSLHSFGFAIDINPRDNPVEQNGEPITPGYRDLENPQTLTDKHPVVKYLEERGWDWDGRYSEPYSDYHHFAKPLATEEYKKELASQLAAGYITEEKYQERLTRAIYNSEHLNDYHQIPKEKS